MTPGELVAALRREREQLEKEAAEASALAAKAMIMQIAGQVAGGMVTAAPPSAGGVVAKEAVDIAVDIYRRCMAIEVVK